MSEHWKGGIKFKVIITTTGEGIKWALPLTKIDFIASILHYRVTVLLFLLLSFVVSVRQFYGNPIQCSIGIDLDDPLNGIADTYCWIYSTYTVPSNPSFVSHPGLTSVRLPLNPGDIKRHRYYIWVNFVLFFQAILFYFPRYIWKTCEDGKVTMLTTTFRKEQKLTDEIKNMKELKTYLRAHVGFNQNYFIHFLLAEGLNFVNVIIQIIFLDYFLGNEFTTYGAKVLGFVEQDPENRVDVIEEVFPKVSKCTFEKYGPSGGRINFDFICLLPINILNEKIFIFIWCWLLMLTVVNILSLTFWVIYIVCPYFRLKFLFHPKIAMSSIKNICNTLPIGDIFLLYQLKRNMSFNIYRTLIKLLATDILAKKNLKNEHAHCEC